MVPSLVKFLEMLLIIFMVAFNIGSDSFPKTHFLWSCPSLASFFNCHGYFMQGSLMWICHKCHIQMNSIILNVQFDISRIQTKQVTLCYSTSDLLLKNNLFDVWEQEHKIISCFFFIIIKCINNPVYQASNKCHKPELLRGFFEIRYIWNPKYLGIFFMSHKLLC